VWDDGSVPPSAAIPASHRDLLETPGVGLLTTVGADGYPQSTALWFLIDGDVIRTSLWGGRQKYRNMLAHPKATLFVLDPSNAYRSIELRGDATFEDDVDLVFLQRLLARYGTDLEHFNAPTDVRVVLTLTPRRVTTLGSA
jgi:PPOX class probable F420-dependent enzyme